MKTCSAIVDRIEDGIMTLELDEHLTLSLSHDKYNFIKEGDVLSLTLDDGGNITSLFIDKKKTASRKNSAKKRLNALFNKK